MCLQRNFRIFSPNSLSERDDFIYVLEQFIFRRSLFHPSERVSHKKCCSICHFSSELLATYHSRCFIFLKFWKQSRYKVKKRNFSIFQTKYFLSLDLFVLNVYTENFRNKNNHKNGTPQISCFRKSFSPLSGQNVNEIALQCNQSSSSKGSDCQSPFPFHLIVYSITLWDLMPAATQKATRKRQTFA